MDQPKVDEKAHISDYRGAPDEQLAQLLKNGETGALDELFTRYYSMVFWIGKRVVRDDAEAQDVTQEVFLALFLSAADYDPTKSSYRTWLTCITYHKAIDRRVHLTSRRYYQTQGLDEGFQEPSHSWESEALKNLEVQGYLREAFTRLSDKQRRVIQYHIFEGKDLRDVAPLIDDSLRNTRSYYHRGMDVLRSVIQSLDRKRNYQNMKRAQGVVAP